MVSRGRTAGPRAARAGSRSRRRRGTRLFEGAGREDAPRIVAELVAAGEQVYEVRVLRSTLEDVYVEAVS